MLYGQLLEIIDHVFYIIIVVINVVCNIEFYYFTICISLSSSPFPFDHSRGAKKKCAREMLLVHDGSRLNFCWLIFMGVD